METPDFRHRNLETDGQKTREVMRRSEAKKGCYDSFFGSEGKQNSARV